MRPLGTVATAMLLAASVVGFVGPASTARAYTKEDVAINGTYRVTSIGNWAKRNEQYNGAARQRPTQGPIINSAQPTNQERIVFGFRFSSAIRAQNRSKKYREQCRAT